MLFVWFTVFFILLNCVGVFGGDYFVLFLFVALVYARSFCLLCCLAQEGLLCCISGSNSELTLLCPLAEFLGILSVF